MTRALAATFVALSMIGCGDDTASPDGGGDGDPWTAGPDGRTLDANACGAVADEPEPIRCVGAAAAPRVALGLCGDLAADNTLTIEARTERPTDLLLGVDGGARVASPLLVEGGFTALGGLAATNTTDVSSDLRVGGPWTVSSPAHVGGDAFSGAHIEASNTVTIDGTLHTPFAEDVEKVTAGGSLVGEVDVRSALECDEAVDIAALIQSVRNEPGTAGTDRLDGDTLDHIDEPSSVDLGCGNYIVSSIGADNTLDVKIVGGTVLVVEGDLRIAAPMTIEVAAGASLDLAIGGSLLIDNTLTIHAADPASVWVGVVGDVRVAAPLVMDGALVLPDGDIEANNTIDLTGSILARELHVAAPVVVHDGPWVSPTGCVATD